LAQNKNECERKSELQKSVYNKTAETCTDCDCVQDICIDKVASNPYRGYVGVEDCDNSDYNSCQHKKQNPQKKSAVKAPMHCEKAFKVEDGPAQSHVHVYSALPLQILRRYWG